MLLCAVHWFNPLFWRAARRLEAEAEIAADDFALMRGVKPSSYANELLAIARRLSGVARVCAVGHTAMARSSALEERLMAILNPNTRRGGFGLLTFARTAAVLLSLSVAVAFAAPRATSLFLQSIRENPTCTPTNP
jgi:beta-lactamase regulating signal transducer with metallopeptidase domain